MPWLSKTNFEARREFVALAQAPKANIQALCRRFNISPKVGYKFLNRFRVEGDDGLRDRSRRPKRCPLRTSGATEATILAIRVEHRSWGGRKIAVELRALRQAVVPAASTITTILARHGLIQPPNELETFQWMSLLMNGKVERQNIPRKLIDSPDLPVLLDRLQNGSSVERRRSIVILANGRGIEGGSIRKFLRL